MNSNFDTLYNEFNGSISAANLADDAVTEAKVANDSIDTLNVKDGAITSVKLNEAFARVRFQNLTTNTAPTGLTIQAGFSFIQGAGNNSSSKTITFPVAFSSILSVQVGQMGYTSGSDPTNITSPTIPDGGSIAVVFADTVTLSGFRAYYTVDSSAILGSTLRKCFSWWAIGIV